MTNKVVTTSTRYTCNICESWYNTEQEAKDCEKKPFAKIKIGPSYPNTSDQWKVGDIAVVHIHDRGNHLGVIVREQKEVRMDHFTHRIIPIWSFLDMKEPSIHNEGWEHENVQWATSDLKRRVRT